MHRDLRVVGAGLHAQVALGARRVEVVAREVRQRLERRRAPVGEAEAVAPRGVAEQPGTEAEGDRQPARGQAERLAGVVRAAGCRARPTAPTSPASRPRVIRSAASVQALQQRDQLRPRARS